jgi:glyoxylate/hydroxypyruvate reductase
MPSEAERHAIAIHVEGEDQQPWLRAFRAAFPHWRVLRRDEIDARAIREVAMAVVWAPPPGFLGQFPNLRQIVSIGAGTDHLSSDPSRPPDIPVLPRQEPTSTRTMAEFVLMQVLMHHRRIGESLVDRAARRWAPEPRGPVAGLQISMLGFGPMAQATAELLLQFGCAVTAWSRTPKPGAAVGVRAGWAALDSMFEEADILVNLLPSTEETRGLIDARRMRLLPRGAAFINVGRGDVVNQAKMLRLLDSGHLSFAYLDVLSTEPPAADDPIWTHPRVILTPHVASSPIPALFAEWVATIVRLDA